MIKILRALGLLEGLTTIGLFIIAMPAKYWFDFPYLAPSIGRAHGYAIIAFVLVMLIALPARRVGVRGWLRTLLSAITPFGTFFNDPWLKRLDGPQASAGTSR